MSLATVTETKLIQILADEIQSAASRLMLMSLDSLTADEDRAPLRHAAEAATTAQRKIRIHLSEVLKNRGQ
jgi:hypothetical protein